MIETKDGTLEPTQIKAKTETSSTKDVKFEDTKKKEDSPSHSTFIYLSSRQQPTGHLHTTTQSTTSATYILPQPLHTRYISCHLQNHLIAANHHRRKTRGRTTAAVHHILHQQ